MPAQRIARTAIALLCALAWTAGASAEPFATSRMEVTRAVDRTTATLDQAIRVTVRGVNQETETLRGFYYAEAFPAGPETILESLRIDGSEVAGALVETTPFDAVTSGSGTRRLVLETPRLFAENRALAPGSEFLMVYTLRSATPGIVPLGGYHWAGHYLPSGTPAFGYGDAGTVEFVSRTTGDAGAWVLFE